MVGATGRMYFRAGRRGANADVLLRTLQFSCLPAGGALSAGGQGQSRSPYGCVRVIWEC
jgi:hypothetical protein